MPTKNDAFWIPDPAEICSVGQIVAAAGRLLEETFENVWIEGEIRNAKTPSSGHAYFTLSDESSQLKAVCFRSTLRLLDMAPTDGAMVLARGRLTVYEPRGDLQLIIEDLEPLGDGLQRLQLEELKKKLSAEGLFSAGRKRELPRLPRGVGVVTSPTGAAVRDIIKVMSRRAPGVPIFLAPAKVQGEGAPRELVQALKMAEAHPGLDLIIIGRGGGDAQDLAAFNDEELTRAVAACRVPVVSAVGHEIDFSLVDLAADVRAATPSMAAELAVKEWSEWASQISRASETMHNSFNRSLKSFAQMVEARAQRIGTPRRKIERLQMLLDAMADAMEKKLIESTAGTKVDFSKCLYRLSRFDPEPKLARTKEKINALASRLASRQASRLGRAAEIVRLREAQISAFSPFAALSRGYSIVSKENGQILKNAEQCELNERLKITLSKGCIDCNVISIS